MWWKFFNSPNASDWSDVLTLARLLPVSNGKLERVFSTLKNIKLEKRSSMSNETLDDLLAINVDQVKVDDFQADHSIELWWKAKTRRPNQQARKTYRKKQEDQDASTSTSDTDPVSTESDHILEDWDRWMNDFCDQ